MANEKTSGHYFRHRGDELPPELKPIVETADAFIDACMDYFGGQQQEAVCVYYIFQYAAASYAVRTNGVDPEALLNALLFLVEGAVRSFSEPDQTTVRLNLFCNLANAPNFELPGGDGMLTKIKRFDA